MLFAEKIRTLREEKKLPQRQIASILEIDTPMYSRIERGERPAKREQVITIAKFFQIEENELIKLWLADKVYNIVSEEQAAEDILKTVAESIVEYKKENL